MTEESLDIEYCPEAKPGEKQWLPVGYWLHRGDGVRVGPFRTPELAEDWERRRVILLEQQTRIRGYMPEGLDP